MTMKVFINLPTILKNVKWERRFNEKNDKEAKKQKQRPACGPCPLLRKSLKALF